MGRGGAVKIDTLYEFLLLASTLNFTETAKNFFVSQSVLSNHIIALEKELGVRLFDRDHHSVKLTEIGALFVADARRMVDDYESAMSRIAHYRDGVTSGISIGFLLGSYGSFLPEVCRRFCVERPNVEFEFRELEIGGVQSELSKGSIDIGFTLFSETGNSSRYEYRCLYRDRYKLAVPKSHRLASRSSVTIDDLRDEVVLAPRFDSFRSTLTQTSVRLRNAGIDVRNDDRIVDAAALMATLVSSGRVAMALDHLSVYGGGNIVFIPIEGSGFDLCAGPMWRKFQENDAIAAFVDFLEKETKGFSREDFLSREGCASLPFNN